MLRKIVKIDEAKCDGCGVCVPSCAEGAIQIIGGKARLVSEVYCDGLGACLGECPQDAISIEEREAEAFDEEAVHRYLAQQKSAVTTAATSEVSACPGVTAQTIQPGQSVAASKQEPEIETEASALSNWPVQLMLAPINAPYFKGSKLLLAGDCVPFALADFHKRFLTGRTLLVGCPKLDNADLYRRKLTEIFAQNDIESIEVLYMEVPCCFGLVHLARMALEQAGKNLPLTITKIDIRGQVCDVQELDLKPKGK